MFDDRVLIEETVALARAYLGSLAERAVGPQVDLAALRAALGGPLAEEGIAARQVIAALARGAEPGIVASAGPRYFGFVTGGSLPAALAADWLTTAWDQNGGMFVGSPAAAVVEEVVAGWLLELFGLPAGASVGFVTGGQMANFTCLAAARHAVLGRAGWDVEQEGLIGAPAVRVLVGEEAHTTIFGALRLLGLGTRRAERVAADGQGRMRADALRAALAAGAGPAIVCAQAGNVNSGAFDPLEEIAALCRERGAWLHVDGAFGLWAAASPALRHLVAGLERAESWGTDAHKWLNCPYDSGIAIVADAEAHRTAMTLSASYLMHQGGRARDNHDWVPEASRRARGFAAYAALRSLGRRGVAELVERCCRLARRMAERLAATEGIAVLNEVVLNQVLVRFHPPRGADVDGFTRAVIGRVQREGTLWAGVTTWHGMAAMRISVSNWSTTEADADRSTEAIVGALRREAAAG